MMATLFLEFWYKGVLIGEIWKNWDTMLDLLGFEKTKDVSAISWDYVKLNNNKIFFAVTERMENHTAVEFYSRSAETSVFESILKRVYELTHYPLPDESCLVNGCDGECSGPLLTLTLSKYRDKLGELFEGIKSNVREDDKKLFTPQIRVIRSSVYPNLEELQELSKKYSYNSKIIKDTLWIDCYWSKFSKTWKI
ncbi:MAG: hypothetical protein PHG85_06845 [Candidatus Altiarchaeota archaeon]|nr:hypothetical protein [Candidatus Altiarchaeota archaeon]